MLARRLCDGVLRNFERLLLCASGVDELDRRDGIVPAILVDLDEWALASEA